MLHFFYKIIHERGTKTAFTYPLIKWFYGQSERAYYLNYFIKRNKKHAECIVELYKHVGILKNTREVQRSTSLRRVLLALLKCSLKFPSAYITQQCSRNKFFYFFYKMYRELHALVPMT